MRGPATGMKKKKMKGEGEGDRLPSGERAFAMVRERYAHYRRDRIDRIIYGQLP